uniref:Uncharacterized protein n=1 Tax=Cyprinus carpio TaxID=7962 RepID=A0A8C1UZR3_CYPCA
NPSHLRELDLSGNKLEDSGVQICSLCRLVSCGITDEGCAALSSALTLNPTHLRRLDLSKNKLSDSGINLLSTGLGNPHCKLEMLGLHDCDVTDEGCAALASALRSNPSYLRELDLSDNKLGDLGVKLLSTGLENCKLEILKLGCCSLSENCCADLASVLSSESSFLQIVKTTNRSCKLNSNKTVWHRLWRCGLTHECCAALASALNSNPSHLRELDLSENNLGNQGVKLFSDALKNPQCKLETLNECKEFTVCPIVLFCRLRFCNLSDESCAALASALRSNPSHLRELELSENVFGDDGVNSLSDGLRNTLCILEILW